MKKVKIAGAVALAVAVVAAGGTAVARRNDAPPPFRRGGTFAEVAGGPTAAPAVTARRNAAKPAGKLTGRPAARANQRATSGGGARSTAVTPASRTRTRPDRSTEPAVGRAATPTQPTPAAQPRTPAPRPPAFGTYTYNVSGWEEATAFGRRTYPEQMTAVVHGADGLRPSDVVVDLRFSNQHEERQIVRTSRRGAAFTFEGGSISFGPGTQTSEADYTPPLVQVPFPLRVGNELTGTSRARNADGDVVRVEDWTSRIVAREVIDVLGRATKTFVVDVERQTREGSAEQMRRTRRYWYDPRRGIWVRWTEQMHGERAQAGFRFAYDTEYTATLAGFNPG